MRLCNLSAVITTACAAMAVTPVALAEFVWFDKDFSGWQAASANYTTVDFTGFPLLTVITNQYSGSGVLFTGPQPTLIDYAPNGGFPEDDWGINPQSYLEVKFLWPMHSVGAHVPGSPRIQLFAGDQLLYQTNYATGLGPKFTGVTSDIAFDRVRFLSAVTGGPSFTDNLYFSTVPGPAPMFALLVASLLPQRRRR